MWNSFIKREKFSSKWKKQKSIPYLKFEHNPTVKLWTNINATSVVKDIWKLRYVCVSGGRKCSSFGKFSILCFLETPMSRFNLLPYYRQLVMKQAVEFIENDELYWSTQSDFIMKTSVLIINFLDDIIKATNKGEIGDFSKVFDTIWFDSVTQH